MNILFSLLSLFFFFLPFQFALSPKEGLDLAVVRIVVPLLILGWLLFGLLRRRVFLPDNLSVFFLSGFLLVASLSVLWSENRGFALRKELFLFSFLPLLFVLSSVFEEKKVLQTRVLESFVYGAFLSACSGILFFLSQFLFGVEKIFAFLTDNILPFFLGEAFARSVAEHPSLLVNISGATVLRASGVFPDPHMFAFYLGMASPIALAFALLALSKKKKRMWFVIFATILFADLLSFSRGGYVGLLAGGALFLFVSGAFNRFSGRKRIGVLFLVPFLAVAVFSSPFGARFLSSFSHADGSNVERLRLWEEALTHIGEQPFFGVGLGNYPLLVKPSASYREPIYAHNLYLDIAVEVGLVGLSFFLGMIILSGTRLFLWWKRNKDDWLALSLLAALVLFSTHAFFETPLFSVHVLPALLLLIAAGVSYKHETFSSRK
jgi:O-antigen ligase